MSKVQAAHASHFCKLFYFSHHLRVTSYNFPFHVHILCIWHDTVLANTAVPCKRVCRYVAPPGECYYNSLLGCKDYFSSSSGVSCAFSAKFGHHPHPLGCAKFCFFCVASITELAHGEKSHTQSLAHLAYLMPREPKRKLRYLINNISHQGR